MWSSFRSYDFSHITNLMLYKPGTAVNMVKYICNTHYYFRKFNIEASFEFYKVIRESI